MNYSSLFNLLYSTEISEATKDEIIDKIQEPVLESCEAEPLVETYLELLDTLVYSTASESLIYNIIDETFSQLSEEAINEVSDEWVKRKVQDSMAARKGAADAANRSVKSGVVGLSQLRRQDQAQSNLEKGQAKAASIQARLDKRNQAPSAEPKAESGAMSKLKSAVGKVKSFVSKADKGPDYVGLSRAIGAKANKDNIGAETLRQQTTHKTEAPAEEKQPEAKAPKAEKVKQPKMKKEKQPEPVQQKLDLKASKAEEKQPEVKVEVKADDATKAAKKTSTRASKISKAKKVVADAISNKEDKLYNPSDEHNKEMKDYYKKREEAEKKKTLDDYKKEDEDKKKRKDAAKARIADKRAKYEEMSPEEKEEQQKKAQTALKEVKQRVEKRRADKKAQEDAMSPEEKEDYQRRKEEGKKNYKEHRQNMKNIKANTLAGKEEKTEEKQPEVKAETEAPAEDKTKEARKKRTGSIKINVGSKIKKTKEAPAEEKQLEVKSSTEEPFQTPENTETKTSKKGSTYGGRSQTVKNLLNDIDNDLKKQQQGNIEKSSEKENSAYEKRLRREHAAQEKTLRDREAALVKELEFMKNRPGGSSAKDIKQKEASLKEVRNNLASYEKERQTANEALSNLAILLTCTNISESSFVEVMEMVAASKANAQKALERDEKKAMAAIDDINKDLEAGKPVDPEKVKNAESDHKKYERFKKIYDKKFNDNN